MLGFKLPKDDAKYQWTNHVKDKMLYYRISESLVKRIVRFPKRKEVGIVPGTTAAMQPRQIHTRVKGKPTQEEIWVMYVQVGENKKRIISAWRYPGVSPVGQPIPIPDDILAELEQTGSALLP